MGAGTCRPRGCSWSVAVHEVTSLLKEGALSRHGLVLERDCQDGETLEGVPSWRLPCGCCSLGASPAGISWTST